MGIASALELLCAIMLGVMLFGFLIKGTRFDNLANKLFVTLIIVLICAIMLDYCIWKMEGLEGYEVIFKIIWALDFPAFALFVTIFHFYFIFYLGTKTKVWMPIRHFALPVLIATSTIWIVSMFNEMAFTFKGNCMVEFDEFWYPVIQAPCFIIAIFDVFLAFFYIKNIGWRESVVFCFYGLMPLVAGLNQSYLDTVPVYIASSISIMLVYMMIHAERDRKMVQQELELAKQAQELQDSRTRIMMSQIQPHFLYNALNSIYYLCGKDVETAQNAISDFSDYLRMNLDSLKRTTKVNFEEELKHTKTYVNLEKMRFDDSLNVVYDISVRDFEIPALSIQPLVENAVKYGVCQKEDGGTVTLSTRKRENYIEIKIEDDGIGFDKDEKKEDGRSHVGLNNVRERIKTMCNGTVEIESEIGKGTIVTVKIPIEVVK